MNWDEATIKLLNNQIFPGNTKVLDDIIHVCIGGGWYKVFAGTCIRDVKYTEEGMEFTSDHINEYDPSKHMPMRYILECGGDYYVVSNYDSPPFRNGGVLVKIEDVLGGTYIETNLDRTNRDRPTVNELNNQIVWIEPNFEVVKENENESSN